MPKILAAVAMPIIAAATVAGLARYTHHTAMPRLALPSASPGASHKPAGISPTLSSPAMYNVCQGRIGRPFTGVAVSKGITTHVSNFNKITGSRVRVVEVYNAFPGKSSGKFNGFQANQAIKLGALPFIQLNPRTITMRKIVSRAEDRAIKQYALGVKKFRCHVMLSFGHEMNGWWYHWGMPWTRPSTFIAAWRHIHDIFTKVGATNVIWSWDPSHQYAQVAPGKVATPASEWYPGNAYVDWVGIDGYLGQDRNGHLQTFREIFSYQLASIASVATDKPIFVAETGVARPTGAAQHGHDTRQIANLFAGLKHYKLIGVIWFDTNAKQPWVLEGRPAALAAYHKGVLSYLGSGRSLVRTRK